MTPTQEQVIAWAEEACGEPAWEGGVEWVWGEVRRFAALAYEAGRKDENEACAKVCKDLRQTIGNDANGRTVASHCAIAIRARREQWVSK